MVVGDKDAVEFCCNEFIEIEMREGEFAIYAAPESLERVGKLFSCVRIEDLAKLVWPDVLLIQTRKPWCITVDADDWYKMPFMRIGCRVGVERVKNCKWVKVEV